MKSNKGFTLVELIMIIAVIGIVSSLMFGSFVAATSKYKESDINSTITSAMDIYFTQNNIELSERPKLYFEYNDVVYSYNATSKKSEEITSTKLIIFENIKTNGNYESSPITVGSNTVNVWRPTTIVKYTIIVSCNGTQISKQDMYGYAGTSLSLSDIPREFNSYELSSTSSLNITENAIIYIYYKTKTA